MFFEMKLFFVWILAVMIHNARSSPVKVQEINEENNNESLFSEIPEEKDSVAEFKRAVMSDILHEIGKGGGVYIKEKIKSKLHTKNPTIEHKINKPMLDQNVENKENDQVDDISEVNIGVGNGVFVMEKDQEDVYSKFEPKKILENKHEDIPQTTDKKIDDILSTVTSDDEVLTKDSETKQESEKSNEPTTSSKPSESEHTSTELDYERLLRVSDSAAREAAFGLLTGLNSADIASVIANTVLRVLAGVSPEHRPATIDSWPKEFVEVADEMINTKAIMAKRMVREVGKFARGAMINVDKLMAGANFAAALHRN